MTELIHGGQSFTSTADLRRDVEAEVIHVLLDRGVKFLNFPASTVLGVHRITRSLKQKQPPKQLQEHE